MSLSSYIVRGRIMFLPLFKSNFDKHKIPSPIPCNKVFDYDQVSLRHKLSQPAHIGARRCKMSTRKSPNHSSELIRNPYVDHTRNNSGTSVAAGSIITPLPTRSLHGSSIMVVDEEKRPKRRMTWNFVLPRKRDEGENMTGKKDLWSTIDSVTADIEDDYTSAPQFRPHHKLRSFLDPSQLHRVEQSLQLLHALYAETISDIQARYIDMDTIVADFNYAKDKQKDIAFGLNYSQAMGTGSLDPSVYHDVWETINIKNSGKQMLFFLVLSRKLKIPPHKRTAYDPIYNVADLVVLASLGIRGLMMSEVRAMKQQLPRTTLLYCPSLSERGFEEILKVHHTTELASNFILLTCINPIWASPRSSAMKSFGENSLRKIHDFPGNDPLGTRYIAYVPHPEDFHHTPRRTIKEVVQVAHGTIKSTLRIQRSKLGGKFRQNIQPHIKPLAGIPVNSRTLADPRHAVDGSHIINERLNLSIEQRDPVERLAEQLENIKHREYGHADFMERESVSDDDGWGPWRFEDERGYDPVDGDYQGYDPDLIYRPWSVRL